MTTQAEEKLGKIRQCLQKLEEELKNCRKILKGETTHG